MNANYYIQNWRKLAKFAVYFLEMLPQLLWKMNHPQLWYFNLLQAQESVKLVFTILEE